MKISQIYDEFQDYVTQSVRNSDNPDISLQDFDNLRPAGYTHQPIVLQNVRKGNKKLYTNIENFKPGTELRTEDHIETGGLVYVVDVPLPKRKKEEFSNSHKRRNDNEPNTMILKIYLFGLLCLFLIAITKTSSADWHFLLGKR